MEARRTIGKIKAIWKRLARKAYRDSYVASKITNSIAFQVHFLREARGWTQKDLADRSATMQPAISRIERGTGLPSLSTLQKLAAAFDVGLSVRFVPISQLVGDGIQERLDRDIPSFESDAMPSAFQSINAFITTAPPPRRTSVRVPTGQHASFREASSMKIFAQEAISGK